MITYFNEIMDTVKASLNSLDENQFKRLVNHCTRCINNGGKIVASGLGKNVPICEKFVGTMNSLGMDARFCILIQPYMEIWEWLVKVILYCYYQKVEILRNQLCLPTTCKREGQKHGF